MCSATVLNGIVGKALQSSVYSDITAHAQHLAFALKTLPGIFKQNGKSTNSNHSSFLERFFGSLVRTLALRTMPTIVIAHTLCASRDTCAY